MMQMLLPLLVLLPLQDNIEREGKKVKSVDEAFHKSTRVKEEKCLRLLTEKAWKEFWSEHTGKNEDPDEVNFKKNMVLVFAMKTYWGCLKPEVTKTRVRETKKAFRLIADLKPGGCDNNMHMHPLGLSRSVLVVVVPKSDKKVDFVLTTVRGGKSVGPKIVESIPEK